MNYKFADMKDAVEDARKTLLAADAMVGTIANLCAGRLRSSEARVAGFQYHYRQVE